MSAEVPVVEDSSVQVSNYEAAQIGKNSKALDKRPKNNIFEELEQSRRQPGRHIVSVISSYFLFPTEFASTSDRVILQHITTMVFINTNQILGRGKHGSARNESV